MTLTMLALAIVVGAAVLVELFFLFYEGEHVATKRDNPLRKK